MIEYCKRTNIRNILCSDAHYTHDDNRQLTLNIELEPVHRAMSMGSLLVMVFPITRIYHWSVTKIIARQLQVQLKWRLQLSLK